MLVTLGLFFLHQLLLLKHTSTETGDLPQTEIHTNGRKPLRILRKEEDFAKVTPHMCRDTRPLFHGLVAKICIRSPTEMISGEIAKTGSWDNELVLLVMKAMFAYPEATFLDLGSNIGMFTVAVAAMGRKVKAVDAGFENHAYTRTSLQLASNLHHVDLIYNGLSDKYETLYPYNGGWWLLTLEELKKKGLGSEPLPDPMHTVLLEDVLATVATKTVVIKIDVEGMECKVLKNIDKLYAETGIFIPYIIIEWIMIISEEEGRPDQCPDYAEFNNKIAKAGYTPHDPIDLHLLKTDQDLENVFNSLILIHKDAVDLRTIS